MSECGKNCDDNFTNIVVTFKELNNGSGNSSQTENEAEENVVKRPRGRPKLTKTLPENHRRGRGRPKGSFNRNSKHSLNQLMSCAKNEQNTELNNGGGNSSQIENVKRPRGRPKLTKTHLESHRRGRGRPKGSFNRNSEHSLNQLMSCTKNEQNTENLSDTSKGGLPPSSSMTTGTLTYENVTKNINEICPLTSDGSLQNKNSSNHQSLNISAKRGRGRPPGAKNKPKTLKLKPKSAKLQSKPSTYLSKESICRLRKGKPLKNTITKSKLHQPANVRDIPRHRFDEAMAMLTNMEHPIWEERNTSCNKSIHRHWDEYVTLPSDHNLRLKFARQFLVRRDWINLSKVLSISLQDVVTHCNSYYSLFTKYASICLAHTDKQQFNKFVQFLLKTEDGGKVLQKCTTFSKNCTDDEEEE